MEYFNIGKIVATHGLDGKMILRHSLGKRSALPGLETLFIEESKGSFIPWFLKSATSKSEEESFINLEEINTKEAAARLLKKEVWITEADFERLAAKNSLISLLGFTVYDGIQKLGKVEEVIEQPHQTLCRITWEGVEVLIPIHEAFLKKLDKKKKEIFLVLPDGLLDVYRQG